MANPELAPGALVKPKRKTKVERLDANAKRRAERAADPDGQQAAKRKADAAQERFRRAVVVLVLKRTHLCECCGDTEQETAAKSPVARHEVHEVVPRSLTMNQEWSKRFSAANCARVCRPCHDGLGMRVGGRLYRIVFHDESLGMTGDFDIVAVSDGHVIRGMRRTNEFNTRVREIPHASLDRASRDLSGEL